MMTSSLFRYRAAGSMHERRFFIWPAALLASISIAALAAATPWLSDGPRVLVQTAFESLCHQAGERSFRVGDAAFAVCHRCFGIYLGIAAGLLGLPVVIKFENLFRNQAIVVLSVGLAPVLLDWGLGIAGLWVNTPATRFLTGLLAGAMAASFLNLAFVESSRNQSKTGSQTE